MNPDVPDGSRSPGHDRAVSPLIGAIIVLLITVALAGMVALLLPDLLDAEPGPKARFDVAVDPADDQVQLLHLAGDALDTDRTRIVWTVDGQRFASEPTGTERALASGDAVTFAFDGVTGAKGDVTGYDSPGTVNVEGEDRVQLSVVDTGTESVVYRTTVTADDARKELGAPTYDNPLVWVDDDDAGATGVEMRVNLTIKPGSSTIGNSLNSLEVVFTSGSPDYFSGTGPADARTVGVDTDGDGSIDVDLSGDLDGWTVTDGGSRLKVGFTGAAYTNPQAGESILLVLDGLSNPASPGTYDVKLQTSGDGNWHYGSVGVV